MSDRVYLKRTVIKRTISSHHLGEERSVRIFLPPGYNELVSYPIVYTQDGQDTFMYGRIATIANYLILEKGMEPVLIVGVDVERKRRSSEYAPFGEQNEVYMRFFTEELCPWIESKYQLRSQGIRRLLVGSSLGATLSLHLAMAHPQLFNAMISLSGAFFSPTVEQLSRQSQLDWLEIWMLVGTGETQVDTRFGRLDFLSWNRRVKRLLEKKRAQVTYVEKEGEHIWGFWQKHLPQALLHFFGPKRNIGTD